MRLGHVGRVDGDVIGQRPNLLQFQFVNVELARSFLADDRVEADRLINQSPINKNIALVTIHIKLQLEIIRVNLTSKMAPIQTTLKTIFN